MKMVGRKIKIGMLVVAALAASMSLVPTSAYADYGPTGDDVVGVGSDTLQQLGDFSADGDPFADSGYNSLGNPNKFISIDATADANTRLAYSTGGLGGTNACAPGTGATVGTANANSNHADSPCTLNPTVVLRAGTSPTQRPNGSGAGYNLLKADTTAGGLGKGYVDFSRASSPRGNNVLFDSITIGQDPLAILSADPATTNAVALSAAQLNLIYSCQATTWNDSRIGGTSSATIVPLLPQVGSGTRSSFLSAISSPTVGACVTNVEENDPEAIQSSSSPANAIEPMSKARLNLFQGKLSNGSSNGVGGYFSDPSCPFPPLDSATSPAACQGTTPILTPNVKLWETGTPGGSVAGSIFNVTRNLYFYFRDADVNSSKPFQPGNSLNWVRTMFYNPCSGAGHTTGCTTVGAFTYGPGGAPFFNTATAQAAISASGITPAYAFTAGGA